MATSANFVQLHNHTHYSLLDGASKIPDLVKRAKELGMPAVGITDHGNMHGAYEMWSAAVNAGIKPIIGIEAYVTPETARQDPTRVSWDTNWNPDLDPLHRRRNPDDVSGGGVITHLTMWAENDEGLVNLMKASTDANLEGRVMRYPRMDKEILAKYSKGIIASSGCPSGIIQTRLRLGQFDDALRAAGEFQDIFGRDNFYIEFMDHGLKIEKQVTDGLLDIAKSSTRRCWPPTIPITRVPKTPARRTPCCASTPAPRWTSRADSNSTAPATTSNPPRKCANCSKTFPKRATTRWRSPNAATSCSTIMKTARSCRNSTVRKAGTRRRCS